MRLPPNTPTRNRVVQGDVYEAAGLPDFAFAMPRPFTPQMFEHLNSEYKMGIDASGLANTDNQVLAENLGNNLAGRIRAVVKFNEELEAAQAEGKREDESYQDLPDQSTLDAMIETYDFSGVRTGGSSTVSMSPMERAMYRFARQLIRLILKTEGYKEMPAPVTVAKKDTEAGEGQVSYEVFSQEVEQLVEGDGIWADNPDAAAIREAHVVEPAEAAVAADQQASQTVSLKLGLGG